MPLDMERDDESQPHQHENDEGENDMLPALRPIYERIGKSLDEILDMEAEIINECTDLEPITWISIYAERFRAIMTDDPTLTKSQVKRILYYR